MSRAIAGVAGSDNLNGFLRFARQRVLQALAQMQGGQLMLVEWGQVQLFGSLDGPDSVKATLQIISPEAYGLILARGSVGAGEAYMDGKLASPDWVALVRLMARNLDLVDRLDAGPVALWQWWQRYCHWRRRNSPAGASSNIRAHYDLSNDFFRCFLDQRLMYSSAIFPAPTASLDAAAEYKLQRVCERLQLHPGDHLLEIGSGWGGLAVYAARHYGCRVTSITLSPAQQQHARAVVTAAGLSERVAIELIDYRHVQGRYSKLVSIEMIEAVGHDFYPFFFQKCAALLEPGGLMLLQAIILPDQRVADARRRVDFIQRYVFPGGCLPSIAIISEQVARHTCWQWAQLEDITAHYAETLQHWRTNYWRAEKQVRRLGFDDSFLRMWDFYLAYCEGGFRERVIGCVQILLAGPAARLPLCATNTIKDHSDSA